MSGYRYEDAPPAEVLEAARTIERWLMERDTGRLWQFCGICSRSYVLGHERYEKLRRLSPREFHQLYSDWMMGGLSFDELVDRLPPP